MAREIFPSKKRYGSSPVYKKHAIAVYGNVIEIVPLEWVKGIGWSYNEKKQIKHINQGLAQDHGGLSMAQALNIGRKFIRRGGR